VDFESVLMYLLVSWGWVVYLICMSRDPQGPSMLVVSGEEDLQGFLSGWWDWFECFGWPMWILGVFQMCGACSVRMAVSMVCMSMDPHGSIILVLSGERNLRGF
jgi:hypothetical protein